MTDPDFRTLQEQYGGSASPTSKKPGDAFSFPEEWETVNVLITRPEPVRMQAPGASGRRVGGDVETQLGPTYVGGGGQQISLANLLRDYWRMPSGLLGSYQQALWLGGFYSGKGTPVFGLADERGAAAFQKAALRAARSGKTLSEVLAEGVAAGAGGGGGGGPRRAPFSAQLTSPTDIARVAEAAGREVLGEAPSAEQVKRIVQRYQAAESSAQRGAYNAAYSGGTVTQAPSLEAFALDEAEAADPLAADAYAVADEAVANFMAVIQGPFDGG